MRIELHDGLRHPQIISATRVVIYDDLGNVVVIAGEHGPRTILTARSIDDDFKETLQALGLDKSVIVPVVTDVTPHIQV